MLQDKVAEQVFGCVGLKTRKPTEVCRVFKATCASHKRDIMTSRIESKHIYIYIYRRLMSSTSFVLVVVIQIQTKDSEIVNEHQIPPASRC